MGVWRRGRKTFEQQRRWRQVRAELRSGRRNIAAAGAWMLAAASASGAGAGRVEQGARLRRRVPGDELGVDGLRHLLDPHLSGDDGGVGESFTREALAGRQFGWPVVDDVAREHRNIDHSTTPWIVKQRLSRSLQVPRTDGGGELLPEVACREALRHAGKGPALSNAPGSCLPNRSSSHDTVWARILASRPVVTPMRSNR